MKITFSKVIKGVRYLKHYGFKEFIIRLQEKMEAESVPYAPWYEKHKASEETLAAQRKKSDVWMRKDAAPLISVVVPLYCTKEPFLRAMIESVMAQTYSNWELCLADASPGGASGEESGADRKTSRTCHNAEGGGNQALVSSDVSGYEEAKDASGEAGDDGTERVTAVGRIVSEYAGSDCRIVYKHLTENAGIAANTNAAIEMAHGEWIAFLDHDDVLAPDALYEAIALIKKGPDKPSEQTAACWSTFPNAPAHPGSDAGTPARVSSTNDTTPHCTDVPVDTTPAHAVATNDTTPGRSDFDLIYTDEDKIDETGENHFEPHLKPDFNIDLLRSNNYITHFLLVKRSLIDRVGMLDPAYDGAQDYDFILRCTEAAAAIGHVPRILYHWRSHTASTADNPFSKQYAVDAGRRAIAAHLQRLWVKGTVTPRKDMGFYDVSYELTERPLVSIIIPNKDEVETLKKCLSSVARSSYENYEVIIVENNSCEATFDYYRSIAPEETEADGVRIFSGRMDGGQAIRIVVWDGIFNYSAINNFGVSYAAGEYLLLLNNDIEFIGTGVLETMLSTCERPEVAVVGAKLYYPDETVQHAGILVGVGGTARGIGINAFSCLPGVFGGYMHKASLAMDYSAVTAACMMVKTDIYHEAGGMTEALTVAFNDVDFCLKVRRLGYLIVYQPAAEAYHYESKSRGAEDTKEKTDRFGREIEYMRNNWIGILKNGDPYYNPNLTRVYPNYALKDLK